MEGHGFTTPRLAVQQTGMTTARGTDAATSGSGWCWRLSRDKAGAITGAPRVNWTSFRQVNVLNWDSHATGSFPTVATTYCVYPISKTPADAAYTAQSLLPSAGVGPSLRPPEWGGVGPKQAPPPSLELGKGDREKPRSPFYGARIGKQNAWFGSRVSPGPDFKPRPVHIQFWFS